jgi:hypothetical protein
MHGVLLALTLGADLAVLACNEAYHRYCCAPE